MRSKNNLLFLLPPLLFILLPFFGHVQDSIHNVKMVSIINTPLINPFSRYKDTITIFCYPKIQLIKLSTYYFTTKVKININDEEDDTENDTLGDGPKIPEEGQNIIYYCFNMQTKMGISFWHDSIYNSNISLDSFNNQRRLIVDPAFISNLEKAGKKGVDSSDKYNLILSYAIPHNKSLQYFDTTIFYLNKNFMDINYELIPNFPIQNILKLQKFKSVIYLDEEIRATVKSSHIYLELLLEMQMPSEKDIEECKAAYKFAKMNLPGIN